MTPEIADAELKKLYYKDPPIGTPFALGSKEWTSCKLNVTVVVLETAPHSSEYFYRFVWHAKRKVEKNKSDTRHLELGNYVANIAGVFRKKIQWNTKWSFDLHKAPFFDLDLKSARELVLVLVEKGLVFWRSSKAMEEEPRLYFSQLYDSPAHTYRFLVELERFLNTYDPHSLRGRRLGNELSLLDDL